MPRINAIAAQVGNPENEAAKEAVEYAAFPAVVCFYRSRDQAEQRYGSLDAYDGTFGFDTYLPCLHGRENTILSNYTTYSDNELTQKFKAHKKVKLKDIHKAKDAKLDIRVYPVKSETPAKCFDNYNTISYKVPALFLPKSKNELTVYFKVSYPNEQLIDKKYLEYKKEKGEATQTIKFKLAALNEAGKVKREKVKETNNAGIEVEKDGIRYEQVDNVLNISLNSFDYNHKPDASKQEKEAVTDIKLTRLAQVEGAVKQLALVAYYEITEEGVDRGKEILIGQLNIVLDHVKPLDLTYLPEYLPYTFDIRFVKIIATDNAGVAIPLNHPRPDLACEEVVRLINARFFSQCGLSFTYRGVTEVSIPQQKYTNWVREVPEAIKEFGNRSPLVLTAVEQDTEDLFNLFTDEYTSQLKIRANNERFNQLKNNFGVTVNALNNVTYFLMNRSIVVYVTDHIDAGGLAWEGDKPSSYVEAVSPVGKNEILLFGKGNMGSSLEKAALLAHELGHCFGLYHTFDSAEAVFPVEKPVFLGKANNPSWDRTTVYLNSRTEYKCYAATDNIMDYTNLLNKNFQRKMFFQYQWKRMLEEYAKKLETFTLIEIAMPIFGYQPDNKTAIDGDEEKQKALRSYREGYIEFNNFLSSL